MWDWSKLDKSTWISLAFLFKNEMLFLLPNLAHAQEQKNSRQEILLSMKWTTFKLIYPRKTEICIVFMVHFTGLQICDTGAALEAQKWNTLTPTHCLNVVWKWFPLPVFPLFPYPSFLKPPSPSWQLKATGFNSIIPLDLIKCCCQKLAFFSHFFAESQHSAGPLWPGTQDVRVEETFRLSCAADSTSCLPAPQCSHWIQARKHISLSWWPRIRKNLHKHMKTSLLLQLQVSTKVAAGGRQEHGSLFGVFHWESLEETIDYWQVLEISIR